MIQTKKNYHGVLLAEWISTQHLKNRPNVADRSDVERVLATVIERVIPISEIKNTVWKGKRNGN